MKVQAAEEKRSLEAGKRIEYLTLEDKYEGLKRSSRQNEQLLMKSLNAVEKELALNKETLNSLKEKHEDRLDKMNSDHDQLNSQLVQLRQKTQTTIVSLKEEINRLKKEVLDSQNEKGKLSCQFQKEKVLSSNKIKFLEESKEKNKKEYL